LLFITFMILCFYVAYVFCFSIRWMFLYVWCPSFVKMQTLILILSIKYFSSNFLSLVFYQTLTWYQMKTTFHHYLLFTVSFMVSFASLTLYFLYISFLLIIIISNEKKNSQVLGLLKFSAFSSFWPSQVLGLLMFSDFSCSQPSQVLNLHLSKVAISKLGLFNPYSQLEGDDRDMVNILCRLLRLWFSVFMLLLSPVFLWVEYFYIFDYSLL